MNVNGFLLPCYDDGDYVVRVARPWLRTDLLKLHQLAMAVINEGSRSQVAYLFELTSDLDERVSHMMTNLEEVQETLSRLTALYPDSLCYGCLEGDQ